MNRTSDVASFRQSDPPASTVVACLKALDDDFRAQAGRDPGAAAPFWLSDRAWSLIEPQLPRGKPGKPRVDDRRIISGILHVLRTGCRWRDAPSVYGPPTTMFSRYDRWSRRRLWRRLFESIKDDAAIRELGLGDGAIKARRPRSRRTRKAAQDDQSALRPSPPLFEDARSAGAVRARASPSECR